MELKIRRFLDEQGRVKQLPAKKSVRQQVFLYLSSKFDSDVEYREKQVNQRLTEWSTISDYFYLTSRSG